MDDKFDFDAMLMYGWVADRNRNIRSVNRSLDHWLNNESSCELKSSHACFGVTLDKFLRTLLKIPADVHGELMRRISCTPEIFDQTAFSEQVFSAPNGEGEVDSIFKTIDDNRILCGWRCVSVGGFPMRAKCKPQLVDLIIVCKTEVIEGRYRMTGLQGQFQDAMLRVQPIVREGTRVGAVALMSRNLSHNIGSHALYWLEDEAEDDQARFYKYLRERMELLAGFATGISTSPRTADLEDLVWAFADNKLLTERLCRSENVRSIEIDLYNPGDSTVALPGGNLGAQAFFSLLENILRDNAKYGSHSDTLNVQITIGDDKDHPDYRRVLVVDDKADKNAGESLQRALKELTISDRSGRLQLGDWGIKERFISAAFLRGIRVEELVGIENEWDGYLTRPLCGEPPILEVSSTEGRLEWKFFLLKPKDTLIIADAVDAQGRDRNLDIHSFEWLKDNIATVGAVRHRIAGIAPGSDEDMTWLHDNSVKLPPRTILLKPLKSDFVPTTSMFPQANIDGDWVDCERLYRKWVEWADLSVKERFVLVHAFGQHSLLTWKDRRSTRISRADVLRLLEDEGCIGLFDHHRAFMECVDTSRIHYEFFSASDNLAATAKQSGSDQRDFTALFEAAVTRILIVDERLDESAEARSDFDARIEGWSLKRVFAAKGVTIMGQEFSQAALPQPEQLIGPMKDCGVRPYHFACIHRGVLDKLKRSGGAGQIERILREAGAHVRFVIVHSGRVGAAAEGSSIRRMPLSNVADWINANRSKVEILDSLSHLRGV